MSPPVERNDADPPAADDVPTDVGAGDGAVRIDGRFRLIRPLARGGMSVVHLAEQEAVGRQVALKILSPPAGEAASQLDFHAQFREEARTLASFQHPNVVVLYDYGETRDGRVYLAMEYVEGARLADLLRRGPLDTVRGLRILEQVARALRYTHQRGVMHRDVSPSNVLVTADADGRDVVKLIDFGISAEAAGHSGDQDVIVGSPSCMSPEQVRGEALDTRTDVYGFGIVAFRTLVGHYPYKGRDVTDTLRQHVLAPIPSVAKAVAARGGGRLIPDRLDRLVASCMAKDAADRPQDMDAVLDELDAVLDELDPERTRTLAAPTAAVQGTRWWLVAVLAIAAAALGAVAGTAWRDAAAPAADAMAAPIAADAPATEAAPGSAEASEAAEEAAAPPPPDVAPAPAPAERPARRTERKPAARRDPPPKPATQKPAPATPEPAKAESKPAAAKAEPEPAEPAPVPEGFKGMPDF